MNDYNEKAIIARNLLVQAARWTKNSKNIFVLTVTILSQITQWLSAMIAMYADCQ